MNLQQRSFSGKIFRPTPEIEFHKEAGLLVIATPWGKKSAAKRAIQIMTDFILSFRNDGDVTSPFERLSCLSTSANNLRIASMLANDVLYKEENRDEYVAGVELFAALIGNRELTWLQLGHPSIFLKRKKRGVLPLGSHIDLPMDLSVGEELMPPLPSQLLGLDPMINVAVGSMIPQAEDQILLISRTNIPQPIFTLREDQVDIQNVSQILSRQDEDLAYWLGILSAFA